MILAIRLILSAVASYLIGAIPTAYIFGKKLKKIDIRQHGSGNMGATNAFRVLGKGPGTLVLLIDIAKGILPTTIIADIFGTTELWMRLVCGLVAVCGHNWTVFLQFKGGKGIATGLGLLIGLSIESAAIRPILFLTVAVWLFVFLATGFVSLSSIVASVFLPIWALLYNQSFYVVMSGIVLCIFVVFRHRPNIKKLIEGKESRVPFPFFKRPRV